MPTDPFAALLAELPPPRRPRHPETGCPCSSCSRRDDALETLAEQHAERY